MPNRFSPLLPLLALALGACAGGRAAHEGHAGAMAREHAGETPAANASALAPRQDVVTREVAYATVDGRAVTGYLARPLDARGALPGIVVVHEWWGLNDNIRMMARRLAGEGYAVLAVDLYGGRTAESPDAARALMSGVMQNPQPAVENLRAAARFLDEEEDASRIGILGWCFGGAWSLRGALAVPERIDAAVMYYGQPVTDVDQLRRLDAPLLGIFGGKDEAIPLAQVREMEARLRELGKDVTIQVYPEASHAFANPSGQSYDERAAVDAWRLTLAFLARHLEGEQG